MRLDEEDGAVGRRGTGRKRKNKKKKKKRERERERECVRPQQNSK
jgi:hypothetical protein